MLHTLAVRTSASSVAPPLASDTSRYLTHCICCCRASASLQAAQTPLSEDLRYRRRCCLLGAGRLLPLPPLRFRLRASSSLSPSERSRARSSLRNPHTCHKPCRASASLQRGQRTAVVRPAQSRLITALLLFSLLEAVGKSHSGVLGSSAVARLARGYRLAR